MWNTDLFLGSLDSRYFSTPRRCSYVRDVRITPTILGVEVTPDPEVDGPTFGLYQEISSLLIWPSLTGYRVSPVNEFPCFVSVGVFLLRGNRSRHSFDVEGKKVVMIARCELYRTYEDALTNRFG